MNRRKCIALMLIGAVTSAAAQVRIHVDTQHAGAQVSDMLYGIFYEDINHAADGGLYAELVSNRSFEDDDKFPVHWTTSGSLTAALTTDHLCSAAQGHALELSVDGEGSVINDGFWGINAVRGRSYSLSLMVRGSYRGSITAALRSADGKREYATAELRGRVTKQWSRLTAQLTSCDNDTAARLVLQFRGKGRLAIDVVSLFPPTFRGRPNGLRPDLADMLWELHPKFLRFPGGCFVEGMNSPENAFRWERTIGPIENRPGHKNVNWGYRTSDGMGFHEYLQLAEDIGAKPLYVVNAGIWHGGFTPVDSLQSWIDETLGALEYANGPVTSKYGAMRAAAGHPAPFNIEYIEIGNENNQPNPKDQSDHYYDRFRLFKKAIQAKYPKMKFVGNVAAWGTDHPAWESDEKTDLVDEHYYRNPRWFAEAFHRFDTCSRKRPKVYVGEYAVTDGFGKVGNLNAALGEAVFMQGMERNSDYVALASYAPIFANLHNLAWRPDMIQYNGSQAFGTPSYYVQKLMAANIGTRILPVTQDNPYPVTETETISPAVSHFGVGTWHTQATFRDVSKASGSDDEGWSDTGGQLAYKGNATPAIAVDSRTAQGHDRTFRVRARKDGGEEGFLIIFNYVDPKNYAWVNLGGWGNTQHGVEVVRNGAKSRIAEAAGHIDTGRWYDIELRQRGDSIIALIDGKQVIAARLRGNTLPGIFSNATLDEKTGDIIVKVTNTSAADTEAVIDLGGAKATTAVVTRLTSRSGMDENDLSCPTRVYPTTATLSPAEGKVTLPLPRFSLNIVRVKQ